MNSTAANTKADTNDTKEIVDFVERFRYMLDVQINRYRIAMQKSKTPIERDMLMIKKSFRMGSRKNTGSNSG